jgi:hypothetical protein
VTREYEVYAALFLLPPQNRHLSAETRQMSLLCYHNYIPVSGSDYYVWLLPVCLVPRVKFPVGSFAKSQPPLG